MENIKQIFKDRPHWMNAIMVFCAYMTFIYMPFDLFYKSVADDQEVWFGFMLTGWYAKATEPLHWLIYGAGFYGFLKMKTWMWPWASVYVAQVAIGMLVWSLLYAGSGITGAIAFVLFSSLAYALWRAKPLFNDLKLEEAEVSADEPETT